jgi:preprotein translocase subunit SecG
MAGYLNRFTLAVIGLLVAGSLGGAYVTGRMGLGTLVFLSTLAAALGVVVVVFLRRMNNPDLSVEQMLYKTDHPTRR